MTGTFIFAPNDKKIMELGIISLAPYIPTLNYFFHTMRFPLQSRPKIIYLDPDSAEAKAGAKIGDIINATGSECLDFIFYII